MRNRAIVFDQKALLPALMVIIALFCVLIASYRSSAALVTRTWDGGGLTNNWSEPANWSGDTVPTSGDVVVFDGTSTKDAIVDTTSTVQTYTIEAAYTGTISIANGVTLNASSTAQNGGTINVGTGTLNLSGNTNTMTGGALNAGSGTLSLTFFLVINGGTFNGGSSTIPTTAFGPVFVVNGGSFIAPSSTLTVRGLDLAAAANFDHNNGTIETIGNNMTLISSSARTLNNLTVSNANNGGIGTNANTIVAGTLTLNDGLINSGTLRAQGPVSIAPSFGTPTGGGGGNLFIENGSGPRTIDFPAGVYLVNVRINDPNVTIISSGSGTVNVDDFQLDAGAVDITSNNFVVGYTTIGAGSPFTQNGGTFSNISGDFTMNTAAVFTLNNGTFTMGSGNADLTASGQMIVTGGTFNAPTGNTTINPSWNGAFSQSGGVFNGNGPLDINGAFNLTGGTFNASFTTTNFGFGFHHTSGGTFNHNGDTAIFDSSHPAFSMNVTTNSGVETFNNMVFNPTIDNTQMAFNNRTFRANGSMQILNGRMNAVTFEVAGDVTIGAGADGDNGQLTFIGTTNQIFTNNGGLNTTGAWTVNKLSGTVTAATDMTLATNQTLNITSGTLYLGNGSDLTIGPVNIAAAGRLINDSSTTITLGGNLANAGNMFLLGGGGACPQADTVLIRSSVNGMRRNWTGAGNFALADVDVRDMGGTAAISVFSGTNSGNNNTNWTFDSGCPPAVSISPLVSNVYRNQAVQFTAGGGYGNNTFSISVNNSGASINPTTGLYTSGNSINLTDTVRVTDAFGGFADAQVTIIPGPATRIAMFVQPPASVTAGTTIAPPVKVVLQDDAGNTVPDATNQVTVTLFAGPPPNGSILSGTLTRNSVGGVATFDDLSINRAFFGNSLQFTAPGLAPVFSSSFSVEPGPAAQLAFVQQPTDVEGGAAITPITVAVRDAFGNHVSSGSHSVTLAIETNPSGGILSGAIPQGTINGNASFFGLSINNYGDGYTLRATSPNLASATSNAFNILSPVEVRNTNTFGPSSFLNAVTKANSLPGLNTIRFNIPGPGPHSISLLGSHTPVSLGVTIDGTTQPGYAGTPLIELKPGSVNATTGLRLNGLNTIRGLAINGFASPLGNGGIDVRGGNNVIQGNHIGTDVTGTIARPNWNGITLMSTSNNLIGGTGPNQRNLISGNNGVGIAFGFTGQFNEGNVIKGNYIGTDVSGTAPLPNPIGIQTFATNVTTIGGTGPAEANTIAFNTTRAIDVNSDSVFVTIRGNSIHSNSGLGIDILPTGPTLNDPGDADTGPNLRNNFPVIDFASGDVSSTTIQGTLNTTASQSHVIDFYSNSTCGASGYGEGRVYIGSTTVTTNSGNLASFNLTIPVGTPVGHFVTATSTSGPVTITGFGYTSEFSRCRAVTSPTRVSISGRVTNETNSPIRDAIVRLSGSANGNTVTNVNGDYSFSNIASVGNYSVSISTPNHQFVPQSRTYTNPSSDQLNQNFVGTRLRASINGTVLGLLNGSPTSLSGVTVNLSGTESRSTTANGSYVFHDLLPGTYTVTAIKDGWIFSPLSIDVILTLSGSSVTHVATQTSPLQGRIYHSVGSSVGSIGANGAARVTQITVPPTYERADASHDGTKIAYVRNTNGMSLYYANSDGSGETLLDSSAFIGSPKWSPDGTRIAYIRRPTNSQISIVSRTLSGSNTSVFATGFSQLNSIGWLSNSSYIFAAHDGNDWEVYGPGLVKLTDNATNDEFPTVSYDGTRIAYHSFDLGSNTLTVMNADGSNKSFLRNDAYRTNAAWSPDGTMLAMIRSVANPTNRTIAISSATGVQIAEIFDQPLHSPDWAPDFEVATPTGPNVQVQAGGIGVTFSGVTTAGTTTVTQIPGSSAGAAPNGFVIGWLAYEITTTAAYTAPVTVCFNVPSQYAPTQTVFNLLNLMHNEGGVLVNRTTSRDFATRTICGSVTTLSPFVIAEQVDPLLPSITGYVEDSNGAPMSDVSIELTGAENRFTQTDINGNFTFVNLTEGESYSVQPRRTGYIFNEYSKDFFEITGENSVVFNGMQSNFSISGRVVGENGSGVSGVEVTISGSDSMSIMTDANGTYIFNNLAADGLYTVRPIVTGLQANPAEVTINPLVSNVNNVDFRLIPMVVSMASISGRVVDANGRGISKATVTLENSTGESQLFVTNGFGYYKFENLTVGNTFILRVRAKRYVFDVSTLLIDLYDNVEDANFIGRSP